ncbi:MAG: Na+:solute symporter [Lentisphaeria bacterium]|nr:Na+:solute symporter [Lentisphaeria bacterium]
MPEIINQSISIMNFTDWSIVFVFIVLAIFSRFITAQSSRENTTDFFLSGKNLPWWLLGISMASAGFSCDTPNLITAIVRRQGLAGNWVWLVFLLTGMTTVFIYSRLWQRADTLNDLDFYEIRYSGKSARFLRGFRSIYLGFFFNALVMASLNLAAIKIGMVFLGISPLQAVSYSSVVIFFYYFISSNKSSIWFDVLTFSFAIAGAIYAAIVSMRYVEIGHPEINSFRDLMNHSSISHLWDILPDFENPSAFIPYLILPFAVQWWTVWYSGAEPGGGGYVVEDLLRAKNDKHAIGATFFYSLVHYVVRPWPWIIVAFCSLVIFPDLASLQAALPKVPGQFIAHDIAYPAMISLLGHGWMGLIVSTLILAYISTIAIHLNIGVHYLVDDTCQQFSGNKLSQKKQRMASVTVVILLLVFSAFLALQLSGAYQVFELLLLIGAGTGPVYLLRWFWWRISPASEISAMISSLVVAAAILSFEGYFVDSLHIPVEFLFSFKLVLATAITTLVWLFFTLRSMPSSIPVLRKFYYRTQPGGIGWKHIVKHAESQGVSLVNKEIEPTSVPLQLLNILVGMLLVYSFLFAVGYLLYGYFVLATLLSIFGLVCGYIIFRLSEKIKIF